MIKNLYLLSGLGADKRAFQYLELSVVNVIHIHWIQPKKGELIQTYASRLLPQIRDKKPVLLGLSFGGIMAIEIGKLIETEKIILISSAQTETDIPFYFRLAGTLRIHQLFPTPFFKRQTPLRFDFLESKAKMRKRC